MGEYEASCEVEESAGFRLTRMLKRAALLEYKALCVAQKAVPPKRKAAKAKLKQKSRPAPGTGK